MIEIRLKFISLKTRGRDIITMYFRNNHLLNTSSNHSVLLHRGKHNTFAQNNNEIEFC